MRIKSFAAGTRKMVADSCLPAKVSDPRHLLRENFVFGGGEKERGRDFNMCFHADRHIRIYDADVWTLKNDITARDVGWSIIDTVRTPIVVVFLDARKPLNRSNPLIYIFIGLFS